MEPGSTKDTCPKCQQVLTAPTWKCLKGHSLCQKCIQADA